MLTRLCVVLLVSFASLAACGDDGGSGGSGSSTTATGNTATGNTATGNTATGNTATGNTTGTNASSTSTGGGAATCAALCAKAVSLGCPTSADCEGDCMAGYANAGMCADELDAFLSCVEAEATTCEDFQTAPMACEDEANVLVQCSSG